MAKVHASGVFIIRKDKKVLICHPTNHDKDFYSIPKGKVEKEEGLLAAAVRETYEETNIDLSTFFQFHIHRLTEVNYSHRKKVLHSFGYVERDNSTIDWDKLEIKCNSNVPIERGGFPEMDGFKWVTIEEAKKYLHDTQVVALIELEGILNTN